MPSLRQDSVAVGKQHEQQKGIIHRDLKPPKSLLPARIDSGDDGADGLLVESLEAAFALKVLKVAADGALVDELVELVATDEPLIEQPLRPLAPHRPALALGEGLLEKIEIAERIHRGDAERGELLAA